MVDSFTQKDMTNVLHGYAYTDWPELSAERSPPNRIHTVEAAIFGVSGDAHISIILAAAARVLGTYYGTTDVLLGVQLGQDDHVGLVRVTWDDEKKWEDLVVGVSSSVQRAVNAPMKISAVRDALSLGSKQFPCVAIYRELEHVAIPETCPAVLSYSSDNSVIHLSTSTTKIHPTVAAQIISQVSEFIKYATMHPQSKVYSTPSFPSELLSISERRDDKGVEAAYPHLPTVCCAPDYLSLRAQDMPSVTAVRWYPELSLESNELLFESISYSDLDRKSNQLARWLLRLGIQPEDRVAVCLERNLYFHAAMVGIMRAGGCYVPIDPELPLERKKYIAEDAAACFVLTSANFAHGDVFRTKAFYLEDEAIQREISQESDEEIRLMEVENLAYLLYTSGTTGNPKGCLLTHKGLAQAILALSSTAADVRMQNIHDGHYLAVASIAFDVHLAETIVPIALGMPLLSARRSQLLENLPVYVKKLGITHLGIVPSLIEATLNVAQEGVADENITLRYIASGGEKMSDTILDKWAEHPQVRLANFYGPSEVTIGCCARYMTSSTPRSNIGQALANVSAYVVDGAMNILCRGGVGELIVEGPLVGRGYHGRPDLTERVFLEWPREGCWAYRTGDLVRMMPDSTIEILGRIDTQIKLRGVRIESEGISAIVSQAIPPTNDGALEVITILAKHPEIGVDQLVSLFSWDKHISIAIRKTTKPSIIFPPPGLLKAIQAKCEAELAPYMRPSHLIPLSWLPLSSNGKADAKVLLELFNNLDIDLLAKLSMVLEDDRRPCTKLEIKVFNVLRRYLRLPVSKPNPNINIFECGLDSMTIIRFTTDLRSNFKSTLAASDIMKMPKLSDIASLVVATKSPTYLERRSFTISKETLEEVILQYGDDLVEEVLPPFTVQEGVLARSASHDTLYVQHVLLSCKPGISLFELESAWREMMKSHQILRTVFHFSRSLSQVVIQQEHSKFNWRVTKVESLHPVKFANYFLVKEAPIISQEINRNISSVPPYRLSIYSSSDEVFLVLSIHHSLFDGISLPLIFHEVEKVYMREQQNATVPPRIILAETANIDQDKAREFWNEQFEGFQWPNSSILSGAPGSPSTARLVVPFKRSLSSTAALATAQQVTLQALLSAAYAVLLARKIYQCEDVAFGVVRSGRLLPLEDIHGALSPLVTIVPMRVDFGITPADLLQNVQQSISAILEFEHIPLGRVQGWLRPGQPLFETLFSVSVHAPLESSLWEVIQSEAPAPDYALSVEMVINQEGDSLLTQAAWMDDKHTPLIHEFLQEFEGVVYELSNDPTSYLTRSISSSLSQSHRDVSNDGTALEEDETTLDMTLVTELRVIVAGFLDINPTILTPSMSFISMGLDSIKSVGLAKALVNRGYTVTSAAILRHSTLAKLANYIMDGKAMKDIQTERVFDKRIYSAIAPDQVKLSASDKVDFFPTTALQTGMLSQTVTSGGRLYMHAFPMQILTEIDIDCLRAAWKTAVETFAILRTSFHFLTDLGLWIQAVHTHNDLKWSEVTLDRSQDYKQALEDLLESCEMDSETSFNRAPFWVRLFEVPATATSEKVLRLAFVMHHALYDGVSVGKLVDAVENFYHGLPSDCPTQFHDLLPYFIQQEKEGTSFWLSKLRLMHPARLLRRHPSSIPSRPVFLIKHVSLDPDRVQELIMQASVTPQCIGQAAWAMTIGKHSRRKDVVFGHTVSGRSIPGAADVVGPVLNTVPCCVRLDKTLRIGDLLKIIHQGNLDALPWQQASLRSIQKEMKVDSLWDSLFLFQPAKEIDVTHTPFWQFDDKIISGEAKIQYPLNIEMVYQQSGILLKCASSSNWMDEDDLACLLDDLHHFIETIVYGLDEFVCDEWPEVFADVHMVQQDASFGGVQDQETPLPLPSSVYLPILLGLTKAPASLLQPATPLVALGIDSITAIQIVGKFRQVGMKLTASDVIGSRTIGDMLRKVVPFQEIPLGGGEPADEIDADEKADILTIFKGDESRIQAVSVASPGMKWLIGAWKASERTRFQHVFAYALPDDIVIPRLKQAWFALVKRHPILRSTFASTSVQREPRIVTFNTDFEPSWSEEYVEDNFFESALAKMQFLVSNPPPTIKPPTQAVLFSSGHQHELILQLHHFQYDAWSLQLLMHDLSSLYKDEETTVADGMWQLLSHYSENEQHLKTQEEYWKRSFLSPSFAPILFPALNADASTELSLPRLIHTNNAWIVNTSTYTQRALDTGMSLQSVLLAAWARIQGEITSSPSSTFGLWHSGRTGALDNISNLAIPCVNVLPIRIASLDGRDTIDIAHSIQDDLQQRSPIVEQSDWVRVCEWVGSGDRPICNVFINIVKLAPDVEVERPLLKPMDVPYYIPQSVPPEDKATTTTQDLVLAELIKDEVMIDIIMLDKTDSILISIDAAAYMLNETQADALLLRWGGEVKSALHLQ